MSQGKLRWTCCTSCNIFWIGCIELIQCSNFPFEKYDDINFECSTNICWLPVNSINEFNKIVQKNHFAENWIKPKISSSSDSRVFASSSAAFTCWFRTSRLPQVVLATRCDVTCHITLLTLSLSRDAWVAGGIFSRTFARLSLLSIFHTTCSRPRNHWLLSVAWMKLQLGFRLPNDDDYTSLFRAFELCSHGSYTRLWVLWNDPIASTIHRFANTVSTMLSIRVR